MIKAKGLGQVLYIIDKIYTKVRKPTEAEFKQIVFDTEITDEEYFIIHAYILYGVLERLRNDNQNAAKEMEKDFKYGGKHDWATQWKTEFQKESKIKGKTKVEYAIKHLQRVCKKYDEEFKQTYIHAWLLDFDEELYQQYMERNKNYGGQRKTYSRSNYNGNGFGYNNNQY